MSYFASLQDQRTQTAIEDWKATANDQVDEIGGWRDADTDKLSRYWADGCTIPRTGPPRMPNGFYWQTAFIMGQIANRYRNLDPSPLQAIYGAVAAWYEDRAADRIPPQASLCAMLEQAMLVLNAIECDIASRIQADVVIEQSKTSPARAESTCFAAAYAIYKLALNHWGKAPDEVSDMAVYEYLEHHWDEIPGLDGAVLPTRKQWQNYVSKGRKAANEPKNTRRAGRTGRSLTRRSRL